MAQAPDTDPGRGCVEQMDLKKLVLRVNSADAKLQYRPANRIAATEGDGTPRKAVLSRVSRGYPANRAVFRSGNPAGSSSPPVEGLKSRNRGASASLQSSEVIVNGLGWMKIRRLRRELWGPGRLEGLAAVNQAANVDSDG